MEVVEPLSVEMAGTEAVVVAEESAAGVTADAPAEPAEAAAPMLKKKEFFERVVALSGARKREVGEAVLAALGTALAAGEEVNLPPFGKAKVSGRRETVGGELLTVKLRRQGAGRPTGGGGADSGDGALAEADE